MNALEKLSDARENLPEMVAGVARVIADNPAQMAAVGAGAYVVNRAVGNLVKPEGVAGILATGIVSCLLSAYLVGQAFERGYLNLKVRDKDGRRVCLRDLVPDDAEAGDAAGEV